MKSLEVLNLAKSFQKIAQVQVSGKPFEVADINNALLNAGVLEGNGSELNSYLQALIDAGVPGDYTIEVNVAPGPTVAVRIGDGIKNATGINKKKLAPIMNEEFIRSKVMELAVQFPIKKKVSQVIGASF